MMLSDQLKLIGAGVLLSASLALVLWHCSWHGPTLATVAGEWRFDAARFASAVAGHPDIMRDSLVAAAQDWREVRLIFADDKLTVQRPSGIQYLQLEVVIAGEEPPFLVVKNVYGAMPWQAEISLHEQGIFVRMGVQELPFVRIDRIREPQ